MKSRLRAQDSAALASSIYIVCKKMRRKVGWFSEVKDEIRIHLNEKLDKLWLEGVSGADFFYCWN